MHALQQLPPSSSAEALLLVATLVLAAAAVRWLPGLFARGPAAAFAGGVMISFVPVQVIAFVAEGRRMWLPGQHSAIFFWGDLLLLPGAAAALAVVRRAWQRQSTGDLALAESRAWRLACLAVAVAVAAGYHLTQAADWSPMTLHAPSKVWHDYFVYPVFAYYLLSQVPYLVQYRWSRARPGVVLALATVLVGVFGWWGLGHWYDTQPIDSRPALPFMSAARGP